MYQTLPDTAPAPGLFLGPGEDRDVNIGVFICQQGEGCGRGMGRVRHCRGARGRVDTSVSSLRAHSLEPRSWFSLLTL